MTSLAAPVQKLVSEKPSTHYIVTVLYFTSVNPRHLKLLKQGRMMPPNDQWFGPAKKTFYPLYNKSTPEYVAMTV